MFVFDKAMENNSSVVSDRTTVASANKTKSETFFRILKEEIMRIKDILPLENEKSGVLEQKEFYNKMVEHLEKEKNQKETKSVANSPKHRDATTMMKPQSYFEGQDDLISQAEDIHDYLDNIEGLENKPVKFDYQGIERGICRHCKIHQCPYYESIGCTLGKFNDRNLFNCINCKCPMSSHKILTSHSYFSIPIAQYLEKKAFGPNHLNFNSFVAIFLTNIDRKRLDVELFSLWEYLNYGGFTLIAFNEIKLPDMLMKLLEKKLLGRSHEFNKNQYETLGLLLENIEDLKRAFQDKKKAGKSFIKSKITTKKNLNETAMIGEDYSLQQFEDILQKLDNKLNERGNKLSIVVSFSHKDLKDFETFKSFLKSNQAPKGFELFYHSKDVKKAFLDMQIFFPEAFRMNYMTFMISPPSISNESDITQENFLRLLRIEEDKFKDLMHFNGFTIFNEESQEILSEDFSMKVPQSFGLFMADHANLMNFFFRQEGVLMNFCGKFGTSSLIEMNSELSPNYYKISDQFQNQCIFKKFYPKLSTYQRVLVILRPNVLLSDMDELIINLYRINNFTTIKREIIKLSERQAYYLAKIERIPEIAIQSYINFMLNGPVELILMSNFGAIALSKAITQGCSSKLFLKNPFLKDKEFMILQENGDYRTKEVLMKKFDNFYEGVRSLNPFNGVKGLLDPGKLILDEGNSKLIQERVVIDESSKQIFYQENPNKKIVNHALEFRKGQLFKEMNHDGFNFFVFSAENESVTEELTSIFLGECSLLAMVQVLIKPNVIQFANEIATTLVDMGFQIVYQKRMLLKSPDAERLIKSLNGFTEDQNYNRNLVNFWISDQVEVLSLVKTACKKEILSLLRNFQLTKCDPATLGHLPIPKPQLSKFLVPCWTESSYVVSLSLINPALIESWESLQNYPVDPPDQNLMNILEYAVRNCVGDCLKEKGFIEEIKFEGSINEETNSHLHFHVVGKRLGDFEIRFRKVSADINPSALSSLEFQYRLIGWYYSQINNTMFQKTPISYHYKILSDSLTHFLQIFDCQQYVGMNFISEILTQMKTHAEAPQVQLKAQGASPTTSPKASPKVMRYQSSIRGNIVAYLWGSKLARFIKTMETLENRMEGFGEIKIIDGKLRGVYTKNQMFFEEKKRMDEILKKIDDNLFELYDMETIAHNRRPDEKLKIEETIKYKFHQITKNLHIILNSESYKYLRQQKNLRVLPYELDLENLRIFCNREQILEILLHGEFETLNFFYEINENQNKARDPHDKTVESRLLHYNDYCLMNVKPEIKSKYSLVAKIFYILHNERGILERMQKESKQMLEALINGIKEGFNKTYWLDQEDLEFLQLLHKEAVVVESTIKTKFPDLIKLEVFFYSLEQIDRNLDYYKKMKENIDEVSVLKQKKILEFKKKLALAESDQIKDLTKQKKNCENEYESIKEKLLQEIDNQKTTCLLLFESLAKFAIFYNYEEFFLKEDETKAFNTKVKIPREKYFKPFIKENFEFNLDDDRYKKDLNEMFRYKDDVFEKYQGAVFYHNVPNDPLQQTWLEKRPVWVRNLREVHKEEKDGVLVEKIMPNAEKMLRNAIEKEVQKFKDFKNKNLSEKEDENTRRGTNFFN